MSCKSNTDRVIGAASGQAETGVWRQELFAQEVRCFEVEPDACVTVGALAGTAGQVRGRSDFVAIGNRAVYFRSGKQANVVEKRDARRWALSHHHPQRLYQYQK